jgi:hypothetical protein
MINLKPGDIWSCRVNTETEYYLILDDKNLVAISKTISDEHNLNKIDFVRGTRFPIKDIFKIIDMDLKSYSVRLIKNISVKPLSRFQLIMEEINGP